jgi:hypothetical protein
MVIIILQVFGANHTLTFDEFLDKVASGAEASAAGRVLANKVPLNVHWRPQADICQVVQRFRFNLTSTSI